jgi:hypothetical protein
MYIDKYKYMYIYICIGRTVILGSDTNEKEKNEIISYMLASLTSSLDLEKNDLILKYLDENKGVPGVGTGVRVGDIDGGDLEGVYRVLLQCDRSLICLKGFIIGDICIYRYTCIYIYLYIYACE